MFVKQTVNEIQLSNIRTVYLVRFPDISDTKKSVSRTDGMDSVLVSFLHRDSTTAYYYVSMLTTVAFSLS